MQNISLEEQKNIFNYINDGLIRHFNKKQEGSLTGVSLNIFKDKNNINKELIFLSGVNFNGPNTGDGIKNQIYGILNIDSFLLLEEIIIDYLGYKTNNKEKKEEIILNNKTTNIKIIKENNFLKISFLNKENNNVIDFDLQYLDIIKLYKNILKIKNIINNKEELENIINLNEKIKSLNLPNNYLNVKGNDGTERKITPVSIEHKSINLKDKMIIGSFFKLRNSFLNQKTYNDEILGSKYPITIITQQKGCSFSLPVEEEISILLEKFLRAFSDPLVNKNKKFLSDKEEEFLKENGILNVFNKDGIDMYQFKIYSETGTIQYSINSKDKSLTVSRIGIGTTEDLNRIKQILLKIKNNLESGEIDFKEKEKLKYKYDKILDFGKKINDSKNNKKPYFTDFVKIDDVNGFIFKLSLINSYITNPLKHEKEILLNNLKNINKQLEDLSIDKNNILKIIDLLNNLNQEKSFFKKELKLNDNIYFIYDSRFVSNLLAENEDKNHKTFKFLFKINDKKIYMLLDLKDVKNFLDNNDFKKEIKYKLNGKEIFKKFFINKKGEFFYSDIENNFTGKIDIDNLKKNKEIIKKEFIMQDIYLGKFYDKNYLYYHYKINNFDKEKNILNYNKNIDNKIIKKNNFKNI